MLAIKSIADRNTRLFCALLICFIIIAIPLNNCYEIAAMMSGTLKSNIEQLTPIYFKFIKDVFFAISGLLFINSCFRSPSSAKIFTTKPFVLLNIFVVILALTALYALSFMPAYIVLMGIRGYWSLGFIYIGALFYKFNERKIYLYIIAIFSLHFLLQIVQFFTDVGYTVYFEHRSPGLFVIPATSGAFALLVHYFSIKFKSTALKLLSVVSLVLSNSTTGLLILIVYYIYIFRNKFKPKVLFYPIYFALIAVTSVELILHMGEITGRESGASFSILTRLGILYLALNNWTNLIFGQGMGIATSQALISGYSNAFIADNTYIGILYNSGILPALIMLWFVFLCFRYFENKLLYLLLLGYSLTTVIFEMNPVIQIVLILLGSHIGRKYAATASKGGSQERGELHGTLTFRKLSASEDAKVVADHHEPRILTAGTADPTTNGAG